MSDIDVTKHLDYLTLVETCRVDGRAFEVHYNATSRMFQTFIDGARCSSVTIIGVHDAIVNHCGKSEETLRQEAERSAQARRVSDEWVRQEQDIRAENERLRAENARLKALARDYLAQCECPVLDDPPWQQALTEAVRE